MLSKALAAVFSLSIAVVLMSCRSIDDRLCHDETFFCKEDWEDEVGELSAQDLYRLDLVYTDAVGGGSPALEEELGNRGDGALQAVLDRSRGARNFSYFAMLSIISAVRAKSGINACVPPYKDRFISMLRDIDNDDAYSDLADDFQSHCAVAAKGEPALSG